MSLTGEVEFTATELSFEQRRDWLRLIRTDNIGPATFRQLINRFGSASAALNALPDLALRGGATKSVKPPEPEDAEAELEAIDALGARLVAIGEADYPPLLRHIHGPPPMLAVLGSADVLTGECVGIVGARNASAAGRTLTQRLAAELGEAGYLIASGLARGIDAAAHAAALETGTIAMLAGGLDRIYPEENLDLAEQILARGGALVSEMPIGHTPRARDFPRRNRLISGVSRGVIVIEAAARSGSLITARLALEQNREVFAVPGSPLDPRAEGVNRLIRDGATLTREAADVIDVLSATRHPEPFAEPAAEPAFDPIDAPEASDDDRDLLAGMLSVTPTAVDDLVAQSGLDVTRVQTILLELEIAGRIERSSGQLVSLVA